MRCVVVTVPQEPDAHSPYTIGAEYVTIGVGGWGTTTGTIGEQLLTTVYVVRVLLTTLNLWSFPLTAHTGTSSTTAIHKNRSISYLDRGEVLDD